MKYLLLFIALPVFFACKTPKDATTKMSAHLHFGTISIREAYWAFIRNKSLIRELVFRSFYLKIYSLKPELQRGKAYREKLDKNIKWNSLSNSKKEWKAWITGTTGFPLCDAGMRQLLYENWVHNRVRMIVATVPTRYLRIDWRDCLKYFYKNLVDADVFSNTAGWQWSCGVGPDGAPFFRPPMNPFIQSKKFDENAEYIKKWIPELKDVDSKDIHKWFDEKIRNKYPDCKYPEPIVNYQEASKKTVLEYKKAYY
jgi:deoxyribodipyrimidine photo-lyase